MSFLPLSFFFDIVFLPQDRQLLADGAQGVTRLSFTDSVLLLLAHTSVHDFPCVASRYLHA